MGCRMSVSQAQAGLPVEPEVPAVPPVDLHSPDAKLVAVLLPDSFVKESANAAAAVASHRQGEPEVPPVDVRSPHAKLVAVLLPDSFVKEAAQAAAAGASHRQREAVSSAALTRDNLDTLRSRSSCLPSAKAHAFSGSLNSFLARRVFLHRWDAVAGPQADGFLPALSGQRYCDVRELHGRVVIMRGWQRRSGLPPTSIGNVFSASAAEAKLVANGIPAEEAAVVNQVTNGTSEQARRPFCSSIESAACSDASAAALASTVVAAAAALAPSTCTSLSDDERCSSGLSDDERCSSGQWRFRGVPMFVCVAGVSSYDGHHAVLVHPATVRDVPRTGARRRCRNGTFDPDAFPDLQVFVEEVMYERTNVPSVLRVTVGPRAQFMELAEFDRQINELMSGLCDLEVREPGDLSDIESERDSATESDLSDSEDASVDESEFVEDDVVSTFPEAEDAGRNMLPLTVMMARQSGLLGGARPTTDPKAVDTPGGSAVGDAVQLPKGKCSAFTPAGAVAAVTVVRQLLPTLDAVGTV